MRIGNISLSRVFPKGSTIIGKGYFKKRQIIAVEVGVYYGENAISILQNFNIKTLYLIDEYKSYYQPEQQEVLNFGKEQDELDSAKASMLCKIKNQSDIIFIERDSLTAIKYIKEKVDFIYIDANHDYSFVIKELEAYWKILKSGGIMAGDNFNYYSVSRAVVEFAEKKGLKPFHRGLDWIIMKKEKEAKSNKKEVK